RAATPPSLQNCVAAPQAQPDRSHVRLRPALPSISPFHAQHHRRVLSMTARLVTITRLATPYQSVLAHQTFNGLADKPGRLEADRELRPEAASASAKEPGSAGEMVLLEGFDGLSPCQREPDLIEPVQQHVPAVRFSRESKWPKAPGGNR